MLAKHYIGGQWVEGDGETFTSINPNDGEVLWQGNKAGHKEVSDAVSAAREAFTLWRSLSLDARIEYLTRYQAILEENKERLAQAIAKDAGKPLWEARTEAGALVAKIKVSIEAYHQRTPSKKTEAGSLQTVLTHRPHGVVVILGPYNFPMHLANGHLVPALLAGNTVIFKPSELTPYAAECLIECVDKANLPKGVVNLVQGDGHTGALLLDEKINGVFFTGSYQTGKKIHRHFAERLEVIVALEMGGNNPLIIDELTDMDGAIFHTIMSAFITSGQRCTCARRLLVPNNAFGDAFLTELVKRAKGLTVGTLASEQDAFMGPVITKQVAENLISTQSSLIDKGAESLLSMQHQGEALVTPGLIDVTPVEHTLNDTEIFGPLLNVIRYGSFDEAIIKANDTAYGLSAGLMSNNNKHIESFYQDIQAGIVNINRPMTGASGLAPFGGIGHSGNHRPSAYYAADFCAYPMASLIDEVLTLPNEKPIGFNW